MQEAREKVDSLSVTRGREARASACHRHMCSVRRIELLGRTSLQRLGKAVFPSKGEPSSLEAANARARKFKSSK